ncbi:MAG: undecaprenyl-diphosphate phosphatase, partial [Butyricicoccus sp.]
MIELLKAFLFGIVEGITEWLPISSTGHMILLNEFVKLDVSEAFYSMFEVVIQLGAILAVVVLFWGQIFPFERRKGRHGGASIVLNMDTVKLWIKILVACVPAAIVGLKWNDLFEELFYNYQTVSIALIVFGAAFILVENAHKGKPARINALTELTYPTVFMIGM